MPTYRELQNGSDIRGVAMEGIAGQSVNLTPEAVRDIAGGFAVWLRQKKAASPLRVAVGRDSRLSGLELSDAFCRALANNGIEVSDFGLASTPAMFMSTVTPGFEYDAAVMLTASHLPFNRNGLKFFTSEGGLDKVDISAILDNAEKGLSISGDGHCQSVDFMPTYAAQLADTIRSHVQADDYEHPLKGFHIVVDAGNGAGGFYASQVLAPLGADISGSQFLEPDGRFPNHIPNPENADAVAALRDAVLTHHADLGLIFDTDVDRGAAMDADGNEINRNRLIAMIAAILLEETPNCGIVTDSITSSGLHDFVTARGGVHHRFKRGYKNVINEAKRLNAEGGNFLAAIETSGHGALKENYFLDDGAYLVTRLVIKMAQLAKTGQSLSALIADLSEPAESHEFRMNILSGDFAAYGKRVLESVAAHAASDATWNVAPDNYEGIRVSFDANNGDGWFLLRMSLHDPLMPLNIESNSIGGAATIARSILSALEGFDQLDLSPLQDFVEA